MLLVAIAITILAPYYRELPPIARKIALGVSVLIAVAPYILFEVFVPRSFDTTSYPKTTSYEFASEDLALDFYHLNVERYPDEKITIS